MITMEDFEKVDMRVGTVVSASINEKAKKPAYKLTIDFGDEVRSQDIFGTAYSPLHSRAVDWHTSNCSSEFSSSSNSRCQE